jgi:TRAP-type C4-dicarboxylate transport system permease small subunit
MDDHKEKKTLATWPNIVIGLLAAALLAVVVWFGFDIHSLYKQGAITHAVSRIHRRTVGRPALVPSQIQGWMTFRYIQFAFRLPTNYLGSKLNITDTGFLNTTLDKYAAAHKLNGGAFLQQVQAVAANYQQTNP